MWGLNLALVTFNCSECQFKSSKNSKASTSRRTKMCPGTTMEKKIVREAFADMLPEAVAWRQKEQFSDVACSTAIALEWDAAFKGMNDPSGRAVKGVHEMAY